MADRNRNSGMLDRTMMGQVYDLARAQFESPEFRELLGMPLTMARARFFSVQMARYVANRRDCWGYVQGAAPLPVKRLIWRHEQEELVNDPRVGMDHYTLATTEARLLGLTAEDFEAAEPFPGAVASFHAWTLLAKERPWLEAFAASAILEIRNSEAIIPGGSLSRRVREKLVKEVGLPREQLINQSTHVEADAEHGALLDAVAADFVRTPEDERAVVRGCSESLLIDRAFRGALAAGMRLIAG